MAGAGGVLMVAVDGRDGGGDDDACMYAGGGSPLGSVADWSTL